MERSSDDLVADLSAYGAEIVCEGLTIRLTAPNELPDELYEEACVRRLELLAWAIRHGAELAVNMS